MGADVIARTLAISVKKSGGGGSSGRTIEIDMTNHLFESIRTDDAKACLSYKEDSDEGDTPIADYLEELLEQDPSSISKILLKNISYSSGGTPVSLGTQVEINGISNSVQYEMNGFLVSYFWLNSSLTFLGKSSGSVQETVFCAGVFLMKVSAGGEAQIKVCGINLPFVG